jgi:uncharacterized protein YecE (DUF72 family)
VFLRRPGAKSRGDKLKIDNDLVKIGTCSWNYESWVGLVYSEPKKYAVEYLREYAKKYRTVEIDSWFYKIPTPSEVDSYIEAVDPNFEFTIKAPQKITQVMEFRKNVRNPYFLDSDFFNTFYSRIEPIKKNISSIILEFEYMNKQKIAGIHEYLAKLELFIRNISRDISISIECRNQNFLSEDYYSFLKSNNIDTVLTEKQYLPPIVDLVEKYKSYFGKTTIIRLLGGDRKEIEERTGQVWNKIIDPKPIPSVGKAIGYIIETGKKVVINVNNHYEGSAPITIEKLISELEKI